MNQKDFDEATDTAELSTETLDLPSKIRMNVINSVKDEEYIDTELDKLLAQNKAEQEVLTEKGIKPAELTIREQIAHNRLEMSRLDEVHKDQDRLSISPSGDSVF